MPLTLNDMTLPPDLKAFRLTALLEGLSFVLLTGVAMPLKYFYDQPEYVRVIGMAHGLLFVLYVAMLAWIRYRHGWPWVRLLVAFVASLLPFGPFVADPWLFRAARQEG